MAHTALQKLIFSSVLRVLYVQIPMLCAEIWPSIGHILRGHVQV